MKILHLSDEHIRDRDIDEIETCLSFIVETARAEAPDLIVSAGDLFDSQDVKMGSRSAFAAVDFMSRLADIAPVAIVIGTPSHDGRAPEILRFARGIFPIRVASTPEQVYLFAGEFQPDMRGCNSPPDAILTLIPQPTKQFFQTRAGVEASDLEIGAAMSGLFAGFGAQAAQYPGVPHILVYHGCVSGGQASNGQAMTGRDITVSRDHLALSGASLILCGHLHLPQELPGSVFYSGSIYANNIGEDHEHGFYIHRIDHLEKVSRFASTPCRRTIRFKRDMTEDQTEPFYVDGVAGAHVRYELTTWQDEAGEIDKAGIETMLMEAGALSADIRIIPIPRENVRAESVLAATTLREEIQEMAKLRGEEIEPDVLLKAEVLEGTAPDELLGRISGGAV
jgi:DNA repair exonuclease SbcCD nuclease subunit